MAAWGNVVGRSLSRVCSRRFLQRSVLTLVGVLSLASLGNTPQAAPTADQRVAQNYYFLPEVRLRKFHLVRPDLIPYPIVYEVYC